MCNNSENDAQHRTETYETILTTKVAGLSSATDRNISKAIRNRQLILEQYEIGKESDVISVIQSTAKQYLVERFAELSIPLTEKEVPDVFFIRENDINSLTQELIPYGGFRLDNSAGISSVFNGAPIISMPRMGSNLNLAQIAIHELVHCVGKQMILADQHSVSYARQGFELFSRKSQYKPWLLEEGVAEFEAIRFREVVASHPFFLADSQRGKAKLAELKSSGLISDDGAVLLDNGLKLETNYCPINLNPNPDEGTIILPPQTNHIAGNILELLSSKFTEEENLDFLNVIHLARRNPRLISRLGKMIDSKWGKGTYVQLLKCERSVSAAGEILTHLQLISKDL